MSIQPATANVSERGTSQSNITASAPQEDWTAWTVVYSLVLIAVVTSNCLTITAFTRSTYKRKNVHFLLINLAVTDLIIGSVTMPMVILNWYSEDASVKKDLTLFVSFFHWMSSFESIFTIALISADRLYAVSWPLRYRVLTTRPYIRGVALSWLLAASLSFGIVMKRSSRSTFYVIVLTYLLGIATALIVYIALWVVWKNSQNTRQARNNPDIDARLMRTLLIVSVVFLFACSPYVIIKILWDQICPFKSYTSCYNIIYLYVFPVARLMLYCNSFCNPVIYSFRDPVFRQTLKKMFCNSTVVGEISQSDNSAARTVVDLKVLGDNTEE